MPSMFEAMKTSFETQQDLVGTKGRTAASLKYTQEKENIEDEIARLGQQEIASKAAYAKAGRGAKKESTKKFWGDLLKTVAFEIALNVATGGAGTAFKGLKIFTEGGKLAKLGKGYQTLRKTKTGKNVLRAAMLAKAASGATKEGRKTLATELEQAPGEFEFIEEPDAEFLKQERKRSEEAAAGLERGQKTMKDVMEGVYEGVGRADFLSPSGIKQMISGAQVFGAADTLVNMADFAKLFGSKQSEVGKQAIGELASLQTPETAMQTGVLEMAPAPSLSPYGAGKEAFGLQPGALPELAHQAAPTVAEGTAQASMAQMFGGTPQMALGQAQGIAGTSSQLPAFLQNLSGSQDMSKALQIGQKFNLKPSSFAESQARDIARAFGPTWSPATAQLPGFQSAIPSSTGYGG